MKSPLPSVEMPDTTHLSLCWKYTFCVPYQQNWNWY
uniref:Uncharacterized protein n=1 Tax=Rhizophora mucronata TaxID=61149 RepID=A0A2P2NPJ5_RHIMU